MENDRHWDEVKTIRQHMMELLKGEEMSARELSKALGIREREVYGHLSHIEQTVSAQGGRISIRPPRCLSCGYIFENRTRFTRPSRCPRCKKSHILEPTYRII